MDIFKVIMVLILYIVVIIGGIWAIKDYSSLVKFKRNYKSIEMLGDSLIHVYGFTEKELAEFVNQLNAKGYLSKLNDSDIIGESLEFMG
jgi:hypothetical protein